MLRPVVNDPLRQPLADPRQRGKVLYPGGIQVHQCNLDLLRRQGVFRRHRHRRGGPVPVRDRQQSAQKHRRQAQKDQFRSDSF